MSPPRKRKKIKPRTDDCKNVCFLCLQGFENVSTSGSYQPRTLARNSGLTSKDDGRDLYVRFLHFLRRHLKIPGISLERFVVAAKEWGSGGVEGNGGGDGRIQAFCKSCHELVNHICDLYAELRAVQVRLEWKVGVLEDTIRKSLGSTSWSRLGVLTILGKQLKVKAVRPLDDFRRQLIVHCKLKTKQGTPKILVSRGLFPEEWKFTFSATKNALMLLIIIFALGIYSTSKPPPRAENGGEAVDSRPLRRRRKCVENGTGSSIKKENGGESGHDDADDGDAMMDYDDEGANDSDWSGGEDAAPASVGSDDDEDSEPNRWNFRKRSLRSGVGLEGETGQARQPISKRCKTGRVNKAKEKEPLVCRKCDRVFVDTRGLSKHMEKIHGLSVGYPCPHCGMKFDKQADMLSHKRLVHRFRQTAFHSSRGVLLRKQARSTQSDPRETTCTHCTSVFATRKGMLKHRRKVHEHLWARHECPICFKTVCGEDKLQQHMDVHESNFVRAGRTLFCPACCEVFQNESFLSEHMVSVHDGSFPCVTCGVKFPSSEFLKTHLESHETPEKVFHCTWCYLSFSNRQYFDIHKKITHRDKGDKLVCDEAECFLEFDTVVELNDHLKAHGGGEIFKCSQCSLGFLTEFSLTLHKLLHTPPTSRNQRRSYKCPECGKSVRYVDTLLTHFNRSHAPASIPYKCSQCESSFSNPHWFKAHMKIHREDAQGDKKFVCTVCSAVCTDMLCLQAHRRSHEPERKRVRNAPKRKSEGGSLDYVDRMNPASPRPFANSSFKGGRPLKNPNFSEEELDADEPTSPPPADIPCEVCEEKFVNAYLLRKHMEGVHETEGGDKPFPCTFCFRKFAFTQTYQLHLRASHRSKMGRYPCDGDKCELIFDTVNRLNKHLKDHHVVSSKLGEEPAEHKPADPDCPKDNLQYCGVCNWGFSDSRRFTLHTLVHTSEQEFGFPCPTCSAPFTTVAILVNHFNHVHGVNLQPFKCLECGKGFFTKISRKTHIKLHERRRKQAGMTFVCIDCGAKCPDSQRLERHRRKHNPDNHVQCSECGDKFEDKATLTIHMRRKHGSGPRFPCPVCGKLFIFRHYIKQHMRVHQPETFECDICQKPFKTIHKMIQHKKLHDPNRVAEYICSECGMAYKTEVGLKFHLLSIHTPESEKPFACQFCPRRFHRKMLLQMHEKTCLREKGSIPTDVHGTQQKSPPVTRGKRTKRKERDIEEISREEEGVDAEIKLDDQERQAPPFNATSTPGIQVVDHNLRHLQSLTQQYLRPPSTIIEQNTLPQYHYPTWPPVGQQTMGFLPSENQ